MKKIKFLIQLVLITILLFSCNKDYRQKSQFEFTHGAKTRGDTSKNNITLVFTGGDYADGGEHIRNILSKNKIKSAFFFTGDFYRNPEFENIIKKLKSDGHYLGAHSDKHLLYCSWENRDSLLVSEDQFKKDLRNNYKEMKKFGITRKDAQYFLPPYEWYNKQISEWTSEMGLTLINHTKGTYSHADYTTPDMGKSYRSSKFIMDSILEYEENNSAGLNGFLLLIHIGTHPDRNDKFYLYLDLLINELKKRDYNFISLTKMLSP